jgi:hypothetical protein
MKNLIRTSVNLALCLSCLLAGCGQLIPDFSLKKGYHKIDGRWHWVIRNAAVGVQPVELDVDDASFEVLGNARYAKDKHHVLLEDEIIPDADPATFQLIGNSSYAKDKSHVYISEFKVRGADPATFRIVVDLYGRDAKRMYCGTIPMEVADMEAFELVKDGGLRSTCYDKGSFLFEYGPAFEQLDVSKTNPAVTSEWTWARDGKYWYYGPGRVEGADYATFRITSEWTAADKNRKYYNVFPEDELESRKKKYLHAGIK